MQGIILAGGRGTRLAPYTTIFPKPLLPIGDIPILDVVIRQLARHGIQQLTLAVGYLAELLMAYFADGSQYGVALHYATMSSCNQRKAASGCVAAGCGSTLLQ